MSVLSWLFGSAVSPAEIRAEIWSLGTRHHGWPLEGALNELKAADLSTERTHLLRACVDTLKRRKP